MNELLGLAYYTEIPAVIVDVQRTGPSTGMPTRTQQADILACAYASHGDTRHILLFPKDPRECFDFAVRSFDLAERFQTPVFLMSDLDIGMNDWVVPELHLGRRLRARPRPRPVTTRTSPQVKEFFRYANPDADYVTAAHPARLGREGRLLHPRLGPRPARALHRGPRGVPGGRRPAQEKHAAAAAVRARALRRAPRGRGDRRRHPGQLRPGGARGARRAGRGRDPGGLPARARLPVLRRGPGLHRRPRALLRRRAEPRRPAAQPHRDRDGRGHRDACARCSPTGDSP